MTSLTLSNARVVLADTVIERGVVCIEEGCITAVDGRAPAGSTVHVVDLDGAFLMPGLIDLHNDALEGEVNPRPGAGLPLDLAFANLERRLVAAGVTTEFHAVAFMDDRTTDRSAAAASERSAYVASQRDDGRGTIDHQVLHRVDVWHPEALDSAFASMAQHRVRYLSLNDHTPGQGQYRDPARLARQVQQLHGRGMAFGYDLDENLDELQARRASDTTTVPSVYARVREEAARVKVHVASHDDDTPGKVDALWEVGARVAEFPVTLEAAERAGALGMPIVVGAPNVVRGASQSGNVSALDVIACGWQTIVCADYHAPSLLAAVFSLVDRGMVDLPSAVRMVTASPARAVGLTDRGEIRPGARADLIAVRRDRNGLASVETVWFGGDVVHTFASRR